MTSGFLSTGIIIFHTKIVILWVRAPGGHRAFCISRHFAKTLPNGGLPTERGESRPEGNLSRSGFEQSWWLTVQVAKKCGRLPPKMFPKLHTQKWFSEPSIVVPPTFFATQRATRAWGLRIQELYKQTIFSSQICVTGGRQKLCTISYRPQKPQAFRSFASEGLLRIIKME